MDTHLKILHLEDMPADAELVERELVKGKLHFEKRVVDNRVDFIKELHGFVPDIIFSDHSLPSFNSIEALKIVRDNNISVPFILITATISEEFAVEVMKAGANDYILKDRMQRLLGAIHNALEKHKLEIERQEHLNKIIVNEALLKNAENLACVGSWQDDRIKKEISWSDENFRIFGYEPAEVDASLELFLKHVHPEDLDLVKSGMLRPIKEQGSRKMTYRIIDKNEQIKYIRSDLSAKYDEGGEVVFIAGFNQDITETILAIESLKSSEANLRTILENSNTAYILIDPDLNIITFNTLAYKYALQNLEVSLKEGGYGIDYFPEQRRPLLKEMMQNALKGSSYQYEITYHEDSSHQSWYECNIHGIKSGENKIIGLIMSLVNITDKKALELQKEKMTNDLIQRNKDLEQFAYIVSHNLRTPVANIIGFSHVLEEKDIEEEMKTECMKGISASVQKLDNVVHDLNLTLQTKREINEKKETVRFSELVDNIKLSIAGLLESEKVKIVCDFGEVNEMKTIKSYLHSIFYNLISNSIKYRSPEVAPVISICSYMLKDKIKIIFKDNGLGINMDANRALVFGLYKRFHTHVEGKGMGLFMTKTQVESLGGKILVSSEVNKGTEFRIEFNL